MAGVEVGAEVSMLIGFVGESVGELVGDADDGDVDGDSLGELVGLAVVGVLVLAQSSRFTRFTAQQSCAQALEDPSAFGSKKNTE